MRVLGILIILLLLYPATVPSATKGAALNALIEAGHWKRVRAQVMPRAQANPSDAETVYLLSRVKQAFGDLNGALELAEKSVALDGSIKPPLHQIQRKVQRQDQRAGARERLYFANCRSSARAEDSRPPDSGQATRSSSAGARSARPARASARAAASRPDIFAIRAR